MPRVHLGGGTTGTGGGTALEEANDGGRDGTLLFTAFALPSTPEGCFLGKGIGRLVVVPSGSVAGREREAMMPPAFLTALALGSTGSGGGIGGWVGG